MVRLIKKPEKPEMKRSPAEDEEIITVSLDTHLAEDIKKNDGIWIITT